MVADAVLSKTQLAVCKAIASDGGWHSGFVKDHHCNYEYDSSSHQANSYEVSQCSTFIFIFKTLHIHAGQFNRLYSNRCHLSCFFINYCMNNLQVLVDPCGGRGWKWMEGAQGNMVSYDESKRFPGVRYFVCRLVTIQIQYIILILQKKVNLKS